MYHNSKYLESNIINLETPSSDPHTNAFPSGLNYIEFIGEKLPAIVPNSFSYIISHKCISKPPFYIKIIKKLIIFLIFINLILFYKKNYF